LLHSNRFKIRTILEASMTQIQVTKRDGSRELLDIEKMHKVVMWATEGITGVSASEVEIKSHIQFYNGIKTADIQETLIKSAADLISEETPNYQYVAGRLINYHLRKQVYGDYAPWPLIDLVRKNVESWILRYRSCRRLHRR
jgi:ribonucleoside-diphosphate reductase alpha chain